MVYRSPGREEGVGKDTSPLKCIGPEGRCNISIYNSLTRASYMVRTLNSRSLGNARKPMAYLLRLSLPHITFREAQSEQGFWFQTAPCVEHGGHPTRVSFRNFWVQQHWTTNLDPGRVLFLNLGILLPPHTTHVEQGWEEESCSASLTLSLFFTGISVYVGGFF